MAASICPEYPPKTTSEQHEFLLSNVKDWSILNGLAVRPSHAFVPKDVNISGSLAVTAPVTLFPSLFPLDCFDEARKIQEAYNELLIEVDDFIAQLWKVHLEVEKEGYVQHLSLGLFRSDYMVHKEPNDPGAKPTIKQVEFNTIASSFGGLSTKVSELHSYLSSIHAYPTSSWSTIQSSSLPANPSITSLSAGLKSAHTAYGLPKTSPKLPQCILFIVQSFENNIFDQLALSTHLQSHHQISTFRLPFSSILAQTSVTPDAHRTLIYHPPHSPSSSYEVTLCYFRAGYSPPEYPTPESWTARLHLERSAAIKCPSILTHLAGSKKIQQELATPDSPHLARFLSSTKHGHMIDRIRDTFTAIYPLDSSPAGQTAIKLATDEETSEGYVLKPQREGGGNNIYGTAIPAFLKSLGDDQRKWRSHILMELIRPPVLENTIFRNGECQSGEVVGELGVYGVCLWRNGAKDGGGRKIAVEEDGKGTRPDKGVLENWEAGFLLRTKGKASQEGGVAAGFGCVDSPCLVDV
ncbi:MAG: hypothetical protein LQ352_005858 [Teloschistes flavicans]|nr:MAG: hypothetical protein LQ352_005858 [Teloschistes flavicans]